MSVPNKYNCAKGDTVWCPYYTFLAMNPRRIPLICSGVDIVGGSSFKGVCQEYKRKDNESTENNWILSVDFKIKEK